MTLESMLNRISQLRGVEEMRVGQSGTTIYVSDLKDSEGP